MTSVVAIVGRPNVGKSSLLNRLAKRRALARTSSTPGKTRLVHWYRVGRQGDEVWLEKNCPDHGAQRSLLATDASLYWTTPPSGSCGDACGPLLGHS